MEADTIGNSAHRNLQKPSAIHPEASCNGCSTVHQEHIAEGGVTSQQIPAKHSVALNSYTTSLPAPRAKRKQPEPSGDSQAQLDNQSSNNPGAQQNSSVQTPAPENLLQTGRRSRRKPSKPSPAANAQSAPTGHSSTPLSMS